MIRETLQDYKKIIEYGIYLLILLNILDSLSTYVGIKYFDASEANQNIVYLFDAFGMIISLGMKVLLAILFSYIIKSIWKKSEVLKSNKSIWLNSIATISTLNLLLIVFFLNVFYIAVVLNNINVIWR
ncbi:MAG: hypothetical protein CVV36_01135 [Candidatus Methanoperedenaceae archaeon HGW-Methanoperedenaceae-1]|jgi:hypothetical protein|nr:MAG: hypothetical protein CVV36_01135 [Candidatus Methanoperedenaceae archaeon HGW-Methanoperedenaceae-1]